jgi:glycosyltransferase involved in cell wall biosynthesis
MSKLKIFYLSRAVFPSEISHSLSIYNLCIAFAKYGCNVFLMGVKSGEDKGSVVDFFGKRHESLKIKLIDVPSSFKLRVMRQLQLYSLYIGWKARKYIKLYKPDIIYSRLTISELIFLPNDIPIYYEMHSLGVQGKRRIYDIIFKILLRYKRFEKIIVTTVELQNALISRYQNVEIVYAPLSAEEPVNIDRDDILSFKRKLFKYDNYSYHIGYTGYLDDDDLRGMAMLLDISERVKDCFVHVVGGSPEMSNLWQSRANDRKINNIYFYGYKPSTMIPYFLKSLDIVLAPLQFRPIKRAPTGQNMSPLKLPQYMAYSKAIVASDIPSHHTVLKDGENALLVKYDSVDEWVTAIELILKNQDLRKNLETNSLSTYNGNFTPVQRVKKILS